MSSVLREMVQVVLGPDADALVIAQRAVELQVFLARGGLFVGQELPGGREVTLSSAPRTVPSEWAGILISPRQPDGNMLFSILHSEDPAGVDSEQTEWAYEMVAWVRSLC
jgi:hypothetical protein